MNTTKTPNGIVLGQLVQDRATGFQGHAIRMTEFLNGVIEVGVVPNVPGATQMPHPTNINCKTLRTVNEGIVELGLNPPTGIPIQLGEKVQDYATGFTGIAIGRTTELTGQVQFGVVPPYNPAHRAELDKDVQWLDYSRLHKLDDGIKGATSAARQ